MKFCSLNARGLGDRVKRKAVFTYLKKLVDIDIIMLQEVHVKNREQCNLWEVEWGGKIHASCGESNSRGVAMLIHPRSSITLSNVKGDADGRILCGEARSAGTDDTKLLLCNLYAPNIDCAEFFIKVVQMLDSYSTTSNNCGVVIGGDFNLVMDPTVDRRCSERNHIQSLQVLTDYMERANLCDVWRTRNPGVRRFTWHRWNRSGQNLQASRIDFFLIPVWMVDSVRSCDIDPGYMSDHSIVLLTIGVDEYHRGKGVWRFNNKLLLDEYFCESMGVLIENVIHVSAGLNPNERWEFLKMEAGLFCNSYAKRKARKKRDRHKVLLCRKAKLESKLATANYANFRIINELLSVDKEIETFALEHAAGAIFRSKCTYARDGEKCSAYFLSLEKRRYLEKNMKAVIKEDGQLTHCQKAILTEQTRFYKKLYEKDCNVHFQLKPGETETVLDDDSKSRCDLPISIEELYDGLMTLKSNKVPGLDGLTIEFYRKFWKLLAPALLEMYKYSFEQGLLPESVRQGLISLLPIKNKDTRYVKNMRPLTLLNNDYKILAKTLDNRLREVLPSIISSDQTGFVKGRKISHNVRKSIDILDITKSKQAAGVILSIDMEKCFDRLEHSALFASLKYFNFGETFVKWIRLFYTDFQICTQNFGELSHLWTKGRGCQQGCPLSPGLYLLTAEILANKLRNNPKIKGIQVGEVEYLISQFADDTDLYLNFDQSTFSETFSVLSGIEANTGLKVSYDKSTLYRIGSLANSDAKLFTPRKIKWSNDFINTLGIDLFNEPTKRDQNFQQIINKMKVVSNLWYYCNMSLSGKVVVINSLMSSLYVYKMQILPPMGTNQVEEVEQEWLRFLWKGKKPKISLNVMQKSKEEGGLGLVNIRKKHEALLIGWVKDCQQHDKIRNLATYFLGNSVNDGQIWKWNLNSADCQTLFPGDGFWPALLRTWHAFHHNVPQNKENVLKQPLCYNSYIRMQGRPFIKRSDDQIRNICHVWSGEDFYKFHELKRMYPTTKWTWLEYLGIVTAIPDTWKFYLKTPGLIDCTVDKYDMICSNIKTSRWAYRTMMEGEEVLKIVAKIWYQKLGLQWGVDVFRKQFKSIYEITSITKLRDFQFRLLHNKIFCNDRLVYWRKSETNICNLCNLMKQTILHLLWDCRMVQPIWMYVQAKARQAGITCEFNAVNIIFNCVHELRTHVINLIVLIVKQYIYRLKCMDQKLTRKGTLLEIELNYKMELYNTCRANNVNNAIAKTKKKWSPVATFIELSN